MAIRLLRILSPRFWRAAFKSSPALLKALKAYRERDDKVALASFEEALRWMPDASADHMAFYATLLILNHRSADAARIFEQIIAGQFRPLRSSRGSQYPTLYSRYYLALINRSQDVERCWRRAKELQPESGFGARYLGLPDIAVVPEQPDY